MTIAERALEFVKDGDVVGLGTGRAAAAFVRALGKVTHDTKVRMGSSPGSSVDQGTGVWSLWDSAGHRCKTLAFLDN